MILIRSTVKPNLLIPLGLEPNLAHSHLSEHCVELNKVDARSEWCCLEKEIQLSRKEDRLCHKTNVFSQYVSSRAIGTGGRGAIVPLKFGKNGSRTSNPLSDFKSFQRPSISTLTAVVLQVCQAKKLPIFQGRWNWGIRGGSNLPLEPTLRFWKK